MTSTRHTAAALSGEGAAAFGGRWNRVGTRVVYLADSLALATLELAVHLVGARVAYTAIELELPDDAVEMLEVTSLRRSWPTDAAVTQRVGSEWVAAGRRLAMAVPSAVVDPRSGERNVLLNPAHPAMSDVVEVRRFAVMLDQRL
ncbi:MAG: RES family NAD+ phosphorylase [Ilumatobacteraceae bacterium]